MKQILIILISINLILSEDKMFIRINDIEFPFQLKSTEAANELKKKLPFTVEMTNYNGNEIYYEFDDKFKKNEKSVGTINVGDIYLYKSDTLVLFYKTFNTQYSYTEIGQLLNTNDLEKIIGSDDIKVEWCLNTCVSSFLFLNIYNLVLLFLLFFIL